MDKKITSENLVIGTSLVKSQIICSGVGLTEIISITSTGIVAWSSSLWLDADNGQPTVKDVTSQSTEVSHCMKTDDIQYVTLLTGIRKGN